MIMCQIRDAALTWHPDDANEVVTGSSNSCIQTQYFFTGVAAHAAHAKDGNLGLFQALQGLVPDKQTGTDLLVGHSAQMPPCYMSYMLLWVSGDTISPSQSL